MKKLIPVVLIAAFFLGCSSNVKFIQTNDDYEPEAKRAGADIIYTEDEIRRPHTVIGVITAELGKKARHPELDALIIEKAREIGADGVMLVEYDTDRDVYVEQHHSVVGRGPWRHHVVQNQPHVVVKRTASGIAFILDEPMEVEEEVPGLQAPEE